MAKHDQPRTNTVDVNRNEETRTFVDGLVQSVRTWLDDPAAPPTLALPPANGFQRLLTYQELEKPQWGQPAGSHPGFAVQRVRLPCSHTGGAGVWGGALRARWKGGGDAAGAYVGWLGVGRVGLVCTDDGCVRRSDACGRGQLRG